jgi:hypothetical protein
MTFVRPSIQSIFATQFLFAAAEERHRYRTPRKRLNVGMSLPALTAV